MRFHSEKVRFAFYFFYFFLSNFWQKEKKQQKKNKKQQQKKQRKKTVNIPRYPLRNMQYLMVEQVYPFSFATIVSGFWGSVPSDHILSILRTQYPINHFHDSIVSSFCLVFRATHSQYATQTSLYHWTASAFDTFNCMYCQSCIPAQHK